MNEVARVLEALRAALRGVPGLRHASAAFATVDPPATYVGPPLLAYEGPESSPTSATFSVVLAVKADDRSFDRLVELLGSVVDAVESVPNVVVRRAEPGTFPSGGTDLPAYLIETEVALNGR